MASNNDDDADRYRLRFSDVADEPLRMLPPIEGYQNMPLVSLEEAVKPLAKHVPDIENKALLVKKKSQKPSKHGLSVDEHASIRLYTKEWKKREESLYYILNANLRCADRSALKDWFLYLKLIITALQKIPSSSQQLLRGVRMNLSASYQKEKAVIWWQFSSCTDSMNVVEQFCGKTGQRTIFKIDCYSGKDIREYSEFFKENEVLLIAATQFIVTSKADLGNGLTIIQLKETEPECLLIEKGQTANQPSKLSHQQKFGTPIKPPVHSPVIGQSKKKPLQSVSDECGRNPNIGLQIARIQPRAQAVIEGERINNEDMKYIVQQIVIEKRCPKIKIHNCEMTTESLSELGRGIRNSATLNEIDLSNNRLSSNDVCSLVGELSVQEMHSVELWRCCGLTRTQEVESGLFKVLNFSNNQIDDNAINYLVVLLKSKKTLAELYLSDNQIGDRGVELLAKALSHPASTLEKLYLSNNQRITDRSIDHLARMFKTNPSLNSLWLLKCDFSQSGRERLVEAAASKRGLYLNVERF